MTRYKVTDRNLMVIGDEELLFDPAKIMVSESIAMERATGLAWPQIVAGINNGVTVAIQAAVWVLRKRSNPKLLRSDVEFNMGDYVLLDPDVHPDYLIHSDDPDDPELGESDEEAEREPDPVPAPKDPTSADTGSGPEE
jgi:hypothetical protein